jgi:hypothetical protein
MARNKADKPQTPPEQASEEQARTSKVQAEERRNNVHPDSEQAIRARREADAQRKQNEVEAREQQLAEAAAPGEHPDVVVATKTSERAARAEQERIDAGKAAAAKQGQQEAAPMPPEEGTLPAEFNPAHPVEPNPRGSSPHSPGTPAGPMDEDIIYVTDDIAPDGTPNVGKGFVQPMPEYDGESDRYYDQIGERTKRGWTHSPAEQVGAMGDDGLEPIINQHSSEGAELDALKLGRPVRYVPNDAALDPIANNPDRMKRYGSG